ncbi:MAG: hypothetical protein AAGI07_05940 [Bacteroidota bacterium]
MLFKLLVLFILFSSIFYCPSTSANTDTVGLTKFNYSSIKKAILEAHNGDTIFIKPGIYTESNILIDKDITIVGHNKHTTFLQASHLSRAYTGRIFTIEEGVKVGISQITLSNGASKNHGGAIFTKGDLKLLNVTIKDCYAEAPGGGIAVINGSCEMENTEITGNISNSEGGGIYLSNSYMNIIESEIAYNQSNYWGGGIKTDNAALNIESTSIVENTAKKGGGIFIHLTGATFYKVDFQENKSDNRQGGNLYVFTMDEDLSIFLNACQFIGKQQKGDILQEAYNSSNYIFMEKSAYNYNDVVQEEKPNGVCKIYYDGIDIFNNSLSAEKDKD